MKKREADNVTSGSNRHVLHSIDRVTHRRSADALTCVELPKSKAGSRFNRFYTRQIGVLRKNFLDSPYTLGEARVLYEIGRHAGFA